jgi:DNA topoisomerase-1
VEKKAAPKKRAAAGTKAKKEAGEAPAEKKTSVKKTAAKKTAKKAEPAQDAQAEA